MDVASRVWTWLVVALWYHRRMWRGGPVDQEPATLTRLPHPAFPPPVHSGQEDGDEDRGDEDAARSALLYLRGETADASRWGGERV